LPVVKIPFQVKIIVENSASFSSFSRHTLDNILLIVKIIHMKRLVFASLCALSLTAAMAGGVEKKAKAKKATAPKEQCCEKKSNCCPNQQCCH
jgi:hypothetical protein